MVGTGPFMFKEWVPNDHVTIVKNPTYWDTANAAHLDEITFKPFADQTAELNALQAGDIDLAQTIAPNDVATLTARPELPGRRPRRVVQRVPPRARRTRDTSRSTTCKIRQAIAYALNKQAYIDAFYAGLANVADNFMPPATQYFKALGLPTYDLEKAKAADRRVRRLRRQARRSTSTTRPTSPGRTCPIRRAWPRRSRPTSRPSASRSTSRPRAWRTGYLDRRARPASSRCACSAGPATGPVRTTS